MSEKKETHKIEVGQKVWLRTFSPYGVRRDDGIKETVITSVGRVYFNLECLHSEKFLKETLMHHNPNYSARYRVYLSEAEYADELESQEIHRMLRKSFDGFTPRLSLETLRKIKSIVEGESK